MRIDKPPPPPPAWFRWGERERDWSRWLHRATAWPLIVRLLVAVSWLSDGVIWYATIVLLPLAGGPNGTACAIRLLLLGLVNLVIYKICKRHFARPRPFVGCPGILARARPLDEHSFPSGHVLHAVAFATLLAAYYPAFGWIAWPFVALVAASRVVLGLHYPSDVLAGAAIGWAMATSVLVLF